MNVVPKLACCVMVIAIGSPAYCLAGGARSSARASGGSTAISTSISEGDAWVESNADANCGGFAESHADGRGLCGGQTRLRSTAQTTGGRAFADAFGEARGCGAIVQGDAYSGSYYGCSSGRAQYLAHGPAIVRGNNVAVSNHGRATSTVDLRGHGWNGGDAIVDGESMADAECAAAESHVRGAASGGFYGHGETNVFGASIARRGMTFSEAEAESHAFGPFSFSRAEASQIDVE